MTTVRKPIKQMKSFVPFIIFFLLSTTLNAQQYSFNKIDSLSYKYYQQQNWDSLILVVNNGIKNGIESYYINLRLGVAYFYKQQYIKAEKFFEKSLSQNPNNEFNILMLHYNSLLLADYYKTGKYYRTLSDSTKKKAIKISKAISSTHLLGGHKTSSNSDFKTKLSFASVGMGHSIGKHITIYESITLLKAKNKTWGNWKQEQLYLSANLHTKKGQFRLSAHGYQVNSNIQTFETNTMSGTRSLTDPYVSHVDTTLVSKISVSGKNRIGGVHSQIGYQHRYRGLSFGVFTGLTVEESSPSIAYKYIDSIHYQYFGTEEQSLEIIDFTNTLKVDFRQKNRYNSWIIGGTIQYSQLLHEHLTLGINIYKPIDDTPTILAPFVSFYIGKFTFSSSYFSKGSTLIAEENGAIIYNTADLIHHRIEAAVKVNVTKSIAFKTSYQFETRTDDYSSIKYTTNSFSGGIFILF